MSALDFVISLAREAGAVQRENFRRVERIERKIHATDLVTEVDRAIDDLLVTSLQREFPAHQIVSEEGSVRAAEADDVWFVDPLDGTTNYAHGYPMCAVSIAWQHRGQLVLGVVYDAQRDETFSAEQGAGAFAGGQRLRVSAITALARALVSTGFHYDRTVNPDNNFSEFARVIRRAQSVRRVGAAALDLAYVAAGRLESHWERGLAPWDCAAGALLVAEAGGHISERDGGPWSLASRWMVASNGSIHAELLTTLNGGRT